MWLVGIMANFQLHLVGSGAFSHDQQTMPKKKERKKKRVEWQERKTEKKVMIKFCGGNAAGFMGKHIKEALQLQRNQFEIEY